MTIGGGGHTIPLSTRKPHRSTMRTLAPWRWIGVILPLLVACQAESPREGATPPSPVIAVVEGQPITRAALVEAMVSAQGDAFFKHYVERQLLEKAAAAAGVTVADEEARGMAEAEVRSIVQGRYSGDQSAFEAELVAQGQDYSRWLAGRVEAQRVRLLAERMMHREIADEDIKALFERRHGAGGITMKVAQILVTTHVQSSGLYTEAEHEAKKARITREARQKAQALRKRLQGGADFAALARQHSDDYTGAEGGWAGEGWADRYGQAFETLVGRLSVGEISPVVESPEGFHVVRVEGLRKGARYTGRYIFLADGAGEGAEQRARARADEVLARLRQGEDFAKVAAEVSEDARTRAAGGDPGPFAAGRLGPEADAILETMPIGEISGPIRVKGGYHIVKLHSREFIPDEDRRLVRHILVGTSYLRVKARILKDSIDARARERAMGLMKLLAEGAVTFEALAKEASEDAQNRGQGGLIPQWRPGLLGPEVDANLEEMKVGQIRLVRSSRGYHLIKLVAKEVVALESVAEALRAELRQRPINESQVRAYLAGLRREASVKWMGWEGEQGAP